METKRKIINRHRNGQGIKSIMREFNIARNTVREIIRSNHEGKLKSSYERSVQPLPALGKYVKNLEELLRVNKNVRPKLTIKQIFEELQLQGYSGSYSAVNRYTKKFNKVSDTNPVACVPLSFAPGEAYQFDWSEETIIVNDEPLKVKVAHFVLCYSRKKFIYIYPNETQEMVFDAHIRAFEFFGSTPIKGIYDNMKTAVTKVLKGNQRQWNPKFEHLCAHYRVEPVACTPARGNEKGRVERQVLIDRQQFFTPMLAGGSLQEINDLITSRLINYNSNHKHPEFKKSIDEIFTKESQYLIKAPLLFDGCKEVNLKVSTTCLVQYDRNSYSVNCSCAGKIIQCRAYADKLIFIYNGKEVANHQRQFSRGKTYYDYHHYLPILAHKPGALRNGAPFTDMDLPEELNKIRIILENQPNGARDFAHILSYIPKEGIESIIEACSKSLIAKTVSKDIILNFLFRNNDEEQIIEEPEQYLKLKHIPQENCKIYDSLLQGGYNV